MRKLAINLRSQTQFSLQQVGLFRTSCSRCYSYIMDYGITLYCSSAKLETCIYRRRINEDCNCGIFIFSLSTSHTNLQSLFSLMAKIVGKRLIKTTGPQSDDCNCNLCLRLNITKWKKKPINFKPFQRLIGICATIPSIIKYIDRYIKTGEVKGEEIHEL